MILFIVVGMILKALCKNVETYAAGHTFYWVGHIGLSYIVNVIISDMTSLRNRMIMWGLYMSPRLASTFGGPKIAELFYEHSTYRWAFGSFCIILVGFSIPVAVVLIMNERKAKAMGLLKKEKSGRTMRQSTIHYLIEFDGKFPLVIEVWSIANVSSSRRHASDPCWFRTDSDLPEHRDSRTQRLGKRLHHRHDRGWCRLSRHVWSVGEVPDEGSIHPVSLLERPHDHRRVLP